MTAVKTISVMVDEELDDAAKVEAIRRGISKSELIRRGIQHMLGDSESAAEPGHDPWETLAGFGPAGVSVEAGEIDSVVYGE